MMRPPPHERPSVQLFPTTEPGRGVFLITAGAYIGPELVAEFGRLPPSFLPVGNRRLFRLQREQIGPCSDRVLMSVPEDFQVPRMDQELLERLGVELLPVPPGLTLGQSVVYCINVTASAQGGVRILHGDTLIRGVDFASPDAVSVGETAEYYDWAGCVEGARGVERVHAGLADGGAARKVLTGYFHFADAGLLVQSITRARGDFIEGINLYAAARPLTSLGEGEWLDFGHLHTFYQSRRRMTTERSFNALEIGPRIVAKSGANPAKIAAEMEWYQNLPHDLRIHTPHFISGRQEDGSARYETEYLHLMTLSDLFVFGDLPRPVWRQIFTACDEFLSACARHRAPADAPRTGGALYLDKTLERLAVFARQRGVDPAKPWRFDGAPLPGLEIVAREAAARIAAASPEDECFVHGDFCFSNILYDYRSQTIRVIDPRGQNARGEPSVHGDLRYDVAKLHHSVAGRYDFIVAGYCRLHRRGGHDLTLELPDSPEIAAASEIFASRRFAGHHGGDPMFAAMSVLLFLSMLPLHADDADRQDALLANALRLFAALDKDARS